MQGTMQARTPALTATLLLNDQIPLHSDAQWYTKSGTLNISDYDKLRIRVFPVGAMANCAEVDVRDLKALGNNNFSVYGHYMSETQGGFDINGTGAWACTAKTNGLAFSYMVWGLKEV